jgi:hypothetical protein
MQDEKIVFVFNKAWFKLGTVLGPDEDAPVVRAQLPTQEQSLSSSSSAIISSLHSRAKDDRLEPMHRAMFEYMTGFLHSKSQGEAYEAACRRREQLCEQLEGEVKMQRRASLLALASLLRYYDAVARGMDKLQGRLDEIKQLVDTTLSPSKMEECVEALQV